MKLVTLLAVLMLVASTATGQTGLNFYVGDCSAGSSNHAVTNGCTSNSGTLLSAIGSIVMPAATVPAFVGAATKIDISFSQSAVPDYWRGDACRTGATSYAGDAVDAAGSCGTIWDGHSPGGSSFVYQYGTYAGSSADRIRINAGTVMASTDVYDLTGDGFTELGVFNLVISKAKSTGTGACAGCSYGACIVLSEIDLEPLVGDSSTWLRITNPVSNNFITYQTDYPTCPAAAPVQNRTWGTVKVLYR